LTFGGETEIESLDQATALDAETANAVVAEEIERIIATSRYGTYGISQALIHALVTEALTCPDRSATAVAFDAWDEAFAVIASRAPRVDASDDPTHPYAPASPDSGEPAPGDLEAALALAALGGLAHASREKKRRALLAAQLLLDERATIAAPAFAVTLGAISDPATLTWLLSVIDSSDDMANPVRVACQTPLRTLVTREFLTARAVARRMVTGNAPSLAPPAPADAGLLRQPRDRLWTPDDSDKEHGDEPAGFAGLVESVVGRRLRRGERILNGLRDAVRARAATALRSDTLKERVNLQLDTFSDRLGKRWPDAFLAPEQTIEETLQSVAAGGRAALLTAGEPIANPIAWEDDLAAALLDDPAVPLTLEAHRQPRPPLAPPPAAGHEAWERIRERAAGGSGGNVEEAIEKDGLLLATLALEPITALTTVEHGPYGGWHWLGTVEKRAVRHRDRRRDSDDLVARRYRVLEVREPNDPRALTLPPVTAGDLRLWRAEVDAAVLGRPALDASQPLVGIDNDLELVGDGRHGLGVPRLLLVPTASLIALLGLRPGPPCSYEDHNGVGLALVTWRAEYDVSDYYLAWPRTCGSGIAIRPDLLAGLVAVVGKDRLVLRDFVVGDSKLAATHQEPLPVAVDHPPDTA